LIKPIQENSEEAIWRVEVLNLGLKVGVTKEISRMERKTEKEPLSGQMETSILEVGEMENNTASAFGFLFLMQILAVKQQRDKVNGLMENVNAGYLLLKFFTAHRLDKRVMQVQ